MKFNDFILHNHRANFKQNLAQCILWRRGFNFVRVKGHNILQRRDYYEIVKIYCQNKKKSSLEPLG